MTAYVVEDVPTATQLARATALVPWATSGWSGYTRGVRDALIDARRMARAGDLVGAEYWLSQAEKVAERHCPPMGSFPPCRMPDGTLVPGMLTYGELWAQRASLEDPYIFDPEGF